MTSFCVLIPVLLTNSDCNITLAPAVFFASFLTFLSFDFDSFLQNASKKQFRSYHMIHNVDFTHDAILFSCIIKTVEINFIFVSSLSMMSVEKIRYCQQKLHILKFNLHFLFLVHPDICAQDQKR